MTKIVIDVYGADAGTAPVIKGVAEALKRGIEFFPVLVGDEAEITAVFEAEGIAASAYETIAASDYISNDDPPSCIFGGRDESSMVKAFKRLKEDTDCEAMLSAGNTGALLVGTICRLGLVQGLKAPALCSALPCARGDKLLILVDCGANIDCLPADLVRFAKMGNVFSRAYCGIESPRVGLMSVGREAGKGNSLIREAYQKISELEDINFVGNLEGGDMVSGYADVIVCDGFCGNIVLKNTEAAGKRAMEIVEKLGADSDPELVKRIRDELFKTFDFNSQGAATFLGPKKIVVKMHGCASLETTVASIRQILRLSAANFSYELEKAMKN